MYWDRIFIAAACLGLAFGYSWAQSSGGFTQGQVLTSAALNAAFSKKTDYPPFVPTQSYGTNDTSAASTAFVQSAIRIRLQSDIIFYVNPSSVMSATCGAFTCAPGNDGNSGLSISSPFLTLQKAIDTIADNYDLVGHHAVVRGSHGTYAPASGIPAILTAKGFVGANGESSVQVLCSTTQSDCLISTTNADGVSLGAVAQGTGATGLTQMTIGGFKFTSMVSGNAINLAGGGVGLQIGCSFGSSYGNCDADYPIEFGNMSNGVVGTNHIVTNHAAWFIYGYSGNLVTGPAYIHVAALADSQIALHDTHENCNSQTFAVTYWAYAETLGSLYINGMTYDNCSGVSATASVFANGGQIYNAIGGTIPPGGGVVVITYPGNYLTTTANQFGPITGALNTTAFIRTTTDMSVTSNTTLADIPSFTEVVVSGKTYELEANIYTTSNSSGGVKFALGSPVSGGAVPAITLCDALVFDAATSNASRNTSSTISGGTVGSAIGGVTAVQNASIKVSCTVVVSVGGFLTLQFAQNASNGSASKVLTSSTLKMWQIQ